MTVSAFVRNLSDELVLDSALYQQFDGCDRSRDLRPAAYVRRNTGIQILAAQVARLDQGAPQAWFLCVGARRVRPRESLVGLPSD